MLQSKCNRSGWDFGNASVKHLRRVCGQTSRDVTSENSMQNSDCTLHNRSLGDFGYGIHATVGFTVNIRRRVPWPVPNATRYGIVKTVTPRRGPVMARTANFVERNLTRS
jgi:hypothetical protein